MITTEEFLAYCDSALDQFAAIVTELGDERVNARLDGLPGSNSAFVLVSHVVGVMGFWGRTTNRGIEVPRDRDAEFVATGSAAEALGLLEMGRARLREDAAHADPRAAPVNPPQDWSPATQGDVLLHVYEELAQHLCQLEVTRDVLLSERPVSGRPARS